MIQMVLATDRNGCIGKAGKLPFRLRYDLMNFKHITQNTVCIMGRKTFHSLQSTLIGRTKVVCTKSVKGLNYNSSDEDIWYTDDPKYWVKTWRKNRDITIMGGSQIYELFAPMVDKIVWTHVDCEIENGDTFYMPNVEGFELTDIKKFQKSPYDEYDYLIATYVRKKK